ncbi:MAG: hypothetical protein OEX02_09990, partial [Cyclobacteriaceae bacterium]|nr:hypothetical protein [Cyclobacteriaceae bacterium]
MNINLYRKVLTLIILLGFSVLVHAQADKDLYRADQYFRIKNYQEAATLYQKVVDAGGADAVTNYRLGYSYYQLPLLADNLKAEPYLKVAADHIGKDIPEKALFHLGDVYHKGGKVKEALEVFERYKKAVLNDKVEFALVSRSIEQCKSAVFFLESTQMQYTVRPFTGSVNSEYTEYNPVISADESIMAFTALRKDQRSGNFVEKIMISNNVSGNWTVPEEVPFRVTGNLGTAGLSPDGQQMLIYIGGTGGSGNLFTVNRDGDNWGTPVTLGRAINSQSIESTASISSDGKTMYLASNRGGGYGGMDIYKAEKDANGNWGTPVNLGPGINSMYDEDAPFIHPDQKTLFFTSDGHNTMGGRDIFKAILKGDNWTKPMNLGSPVNTTANDNYFTLTADGSRGYFSSDRLGGKGG